MTILMSFYDCGCADAFCTMTPEFVGLDILGLCCDCHFNQGMKVTNDAEFEQFIAYKRDYSPYEGRPIKEVLTFVCWYSGPGIDGIFSRLNINEGQYSDNEEKLTVHLDSTLPRNKTTRS